MRFPGFLTAVSLLRGRFFRVHHLVGENLKKDLLQEGPALTVEALQGGDFIGLHAQRSGQRPAVVHDPEMCAVTAAR